MNIKLKKAKEKAVLNFHPWIFSGAISDVEKGIKDGDTVKVVSDSGIFLGYGHFDSNSQIRVRLFSFVENESDNQNDFWQSRWENVWNRKKALLDFEQTNGFRFLFSEGDLSPGFIVDCYDKTAVMLIRTPGAERHKSELIHFLMAKGFDTIIEKIDKSDEKEKSSYIHHKGNSGLVQFKENSFEFVVNCHEGQKTGFFLDQRDNRYLLSSFSKNKTVLNAFGYSGAFSVYALKGSAKLVHTLDISKTAIDLCEQNIKLNFSNQLTAFQHKGIVADTFSFLKEMDPDFYDLIVLDPPAFTKNISKIQAAARGYKDINLRAMQKIKKGGVIFTFSCSQHISVDLFRKIVFGAAKDSGRNVRVLHTLSQSWDHGFSIYHPEGEYLKGLVIQVD
ncbi:MAG: class I SAM-dependent rRNA methyltransferase [Leptospira sp.]|nr:class I SAM-dependent rRNA methyltransferase [Leptospira sp.]